MMFRPPPNCQHIDNWRRCKIHKSWLQYIFLNYRPHCILDRLDKPADGDEWFCPDYLAVRRPPPPTTGSGVGPSTKIKPGKHK